MILTAVILLVAAGVCFLTRAIQGPSLADRVIAVDGLIVTIVAAIIVNSIRVDAASYLGAAVVVAVVGFVGTSAGARFIERRGG